jgi:hypothetical protein
LLCPYHKNKELNLYNEGKNIIIKYFFKFKDYFMLFCKRGFSENDFSLFKIEEEA